jgi:hypothetical protein
MHYAANNEDVDVIQALKDGFPGGKINIELKNNDGNAPIDLVDDVYVKRLIMEDV